MTYNQAASLSIGDVVDIASRRSSKDTGDALRSTYDFIKKHYNEYVKLLGGTVGIGSCAAIKQGHKIYTISDNIPLLHFLTGKHL